MLIKQLARSAEFRNIFWMAADRVWRMAISLVVGVWVVRYLGPDNLGQINYVLAFIGIATVAGAFGFESFLVKELVNTPERKAQLVYAAFTLRLATAAISFLFLLAFLYFSNESRTVFLLFFLLAPQLFSNSFAVVDIAFQAELRSRIPIICRNVAFVVGALLKAVAIITKQDIFVFALLTIFDAVIADFFLFFYYRKNQRRTTVELNAVKELSLKAVPFVVSNLAVVLYMKLDQVLLGKLASVSEVGYFTAATKVAEVFYFLPLVITGSLYGLLLNARKSSMQKYLEYARKIFFYMLLAAIAISGVIFLFSQPIILQLFGKKFFPSAGVLQIYIWSVVFIFAGICFNQLLVIEEMEKVILYKTLLGVILNIVLNVRLIPGYGAMGAAFATLVTQFISSIAANFIFSNARGLFLSYFITPARGYTR